MNRERSISCLEKAFPPCLAEDVRVVLSLWRKKTFHVSGTFCVRFHETELVIPERMYDKPISSRLVNKMTDQQQMIAACLFSRHHDGFVRQNQLEKILSFKNVYPWVLPYVIRLSGEYVKEILHVIYDNRRRLDTEELNRFLLDNPVFHQLIESRVISYWNAYYREEYPDRSSYIGTKIIQFYRKVFYD